MHDHHSALATAYIRQPALGHRPGRILLVGAALLDVSRTDDGWDFEMQTHSTTITENPYATISWLADRLSSGTMLLWRADDIAVPSLIAATDSSPDLNLAERFLAQLEISFAGDIVDVAAPHGGVAAKSFDAVAHAQGLPFLPMSQGDLAKAHREGCHGPIRDHLAARAITIWRLWAQRQPNAEALEAARRAWWMPSEAAQQAGGRA